MTVNDNRNGHGQRKRRAHQKSRRGCRNCKLRRVKCDESRPGCAKCSSFGVACSYDPNAPDLQTTFYSVAREVPSKLSTPKSASSMEFCFSVSKIELLDYMKPGLACLSDDGNSIFILDSEAQGRLDRFMTRTILTVGPRPSNMFQNEMCDILCGYPYLMHMVQALTALHDRMLLPNPNSRQTPVELYHASRAAALINAKLSQPLSPEDRDPLWATAALLGVAAMSWLDASCVEEAWPLAPRQSTDLDWIRISKSKSAVWDLTEPMRIGGRFRSLAVEQVRSQQESQIILAKLGVDDLPKSLLKLFEVDESSTVESSRYFIALKGLGQAMAVESVRSNILILLRYIGTMTDDFQLLLKERDARALLLQAFWYAKIKGAVWWLNRRSELEGPAICKYLERNHPDETEILELLSYPKSRFGMY